MSTVEITLIGKPGCHLCDDARAVVEAVRADLAARGVDTTLVELNILEDAALARKHSENIPVVLIGTKRHSIWRVDAAKLTAAIERQAAGPLGIFRRG
ncbi:glutaredoxin family protein [Leucobacter salsicius]|uniref:glutaredoxin family protein n=1 Tax=Leucobacter salsicius TaxID=664638 RepID=UPI00034B5776|nr:glutaredoxin family protein [Leucobacter salsicius]